MRKKVSLRLTPEPANEADGEEVVDRSAPIGARAAVGSAPDDSSDDDFRKECRSTWARMINPTFAVEGVSSR